MPLLVVLLCLLLPSAVRGDVPTPSPDNLQLASVHAVVADLDTGEILYRKHADVAVPIASVTKLMTAVVVLDSGASLDEWLTIVDWPGEMKKNAYSRLRIGSEGQRRELLRIALMSSENLATNVLASHHPGGYDRFIEAMNEKARALGMSGARFVDPAGLSPDNRATADDVMRLLKAAYRFDEVRQLSTRYQHYASFRKPRYALPYGNTNPLVASSRWDLELTKTGYLTEAGRCLAMVSKVDGRSLGLVLLNSFGTRTPLGDAGRVRRWLTTGNSGQVAGPALEYERKRVQALLENTETASLL